MPLADQGEDPGSVHGPALQKGVIASGFGKRRHALPFERFPAFMCQPLTHAEMEHLIANVVKQQVSKCYKQISISRVSAIARSRSLTTFRASTRFQQ